MLCEGKTKGHLHTVLDKPNTCSAAIRFPGAGQLIFLNASCSKEHGWLRPQVRVPHIFVAVTHRVQLLQQLQSHRWAASTHMGLILCLTHPEGPRRSQRGTPGLCPEGSLKNEAELKLPSLGQFHETPFERTWAHSIGVPAVGWPRVAARGEGEQVTGSGRQPGLRWVALELAALPVGFLFGGESGEELLSAVSVSPNFTSTHFLKQPSNFLLLFSLTFFNLTYLFKGSDSHPPLSAGDTFQGPPVDAGEPR